MRRVAIIGGGITGLTAAFRLQQRGIPVTLFEARDRVGGVIQSLRQDGYLAEFGPNTILETSPKIAALVRDLGLESRRLYSDARADKRFLVRQARLIEVPSSPVQFFTSPLFSLGAKWRLLTEPLVRRAPPEQEESVAQFVLRRLGREFLDYAINPLVAGIYAGDPARLSVPHAFPKLHALEQKYGSLILGQIRGAKERRQRQEISKQEAKKVSFDEGLRVLIDAFQSRLGEALRLRTEVRGLRQSAAGWRLAIHPAGEAEAHEYAAVLYAGTAYQLAQLELQSAAGAIDLSSLGEIHYPPVASVVLGFQREAVAHPLNGFGVLIPAVERFHILGTIFSSSLFPNRAPAGHVTLTSYIGGVRNPELALREANELFELTTQDLRTLLGVRGPPTFRHQVLYRRAIPQYEVGYGRYKTVMNEAESKAPGFFLAGHFRDGISLGDSMVAGHDVATRVEQFLAGPTRPGTGQTATRAQAMA